VNKNSKIQVTHVGWDQALVIICTKCGKQFEKTDEKNAPERIKSELKSRAKLELGNSVRVITASCLNICPKDQIAVAIAQKNHSSVFEAYSVDPAISGDAIFEKILVARP
jgi:predicted metal-binding protein